MEPTAIDLYIDQLKQLILDYDACIAELAPFTHRDGRKMQALKKRKDTLLMLEADPVEEKAT